MIRFLAFTLAVLGLVALTPAAAAPPVTDCPLRDTPFSAGSPLIDILLSPAARRIVEKAFGTSFDKMPERFAGTKAPTFAAILTLHEAAGFLRASPDAVARADAALRRLPVTAADRVARCERYDNDRPRFVLPRGKPRLLLFEKITGFKDVPGFDAAHAMFFELAHRNGWSIVATDKGGAMNPATLRQFDAVIWNNVSGDVLTLSQRRAFRSYVEHGGAYVAVHGSAGDPVYFWDWYVDGLLGARFAGHPIARQFQDARVVVDDPASPIARGLPREWVMKDEWYSFKNDPRASGAHVVATLDESTYAPEGMAGQNLRMGDHPIAWNKCVGRGRMFYSAIGHRPESYSRPEYRTMLTNAILWATRPGPCRRK
jgi:uncharacterized protein